MKQLKLLLFIGIFCSFFLLYFVPSVLAATVEVVGRVGTDALDSQGSSVIFKDTKTKHVVSQTTVDPSGVYSIAVPAGTYDIVIEPPLQSHIPQITKTNQTISANTEINVTLPPSQVKQPADKNYTGVILIIGIIAVIAVIGFFIKW